MHAADVNAGIETIMMLVNWGLNMNRVSNQGQTTFQFFAWAFVRSALWFEERQNSWDYDWSNAQLIEKDNAYTWLQLKGLKVPELDLPSYLPSRYCYTYHSRDNQNWMAYVDAFYEDDTDAILIMEAQTEMKLAVKVLSQKRQIKKYVLPSICKYLKASTN